MNKNLLQAKNQYSTYHIGLLQSKAYRVVKQRTNIALANEKIGSLEWAFLGVLYENRQGAKLVDLADTIGVEAPFVTELGAKLLKRGFISCEKNKDDARSKRIVLTKFGIDFVDRVENMLRGECMSWLDGLSVKELVFYITVTEKIASLEKKEKWGRSTKK